MKLANVYVKSDASLDELAALVGSVAGLEFQREVDAPDVFYVAIDDDGRRVAVYPKDWDEQENEIDGLGDYSFDVEIDGLEESDRVSYARSIFAGLASQGLSVILADNSSDELDRSESN